MAQTPKRSSVDPASLFGDAVKTFNEAPLVGELAPSPAPPTEITPPKTKKRATTSKKAPAKTPTTATTSTEADEDGWIRVGMRATPELTQQVAHYVRQFDEQPTYGQLATWTCEDHPEEVIAMTLQILDEKAQAPGARDNAGVSRAARGRRPAASATGQLNPTFRPEEFEVIQQVIDRVRHPEGKTVYRTSVITAALRVAVRH